MIEPESGSTKRNEASAETELEIVALLQRIESAAPGQFDSRLSAEVDSLLGRSGVASGRVEGDPRSGFRLRERRSQPRFAWYASISLATPILSETEVHTAARDVEIGLFAREALEANGNLDRDELADLHTLIESGEAAYLRLILSNLRLVFHWSKGVARSLDEQWAQDAFQAGCIGLMRGLQSWDHAKGYKLSTYVSWHIRQAVQRWRANEVSLIRLPVHVWDALNSDTAEVDPQLQKLADRATNIRSMNRLHDVRDNLVWDGGLHEAAEAIERRQIVLRMLDRLSEREADVLRLRFGLGAIDEPLTLGQIGEVFGVTRERIRQIEGGAFMKLRPKSP